MRRWILLATALGACWTGAVPARAQEPPRPRILPNRDVTVAYSVRSDQPGVPQSVLVHASAGGRLRIDAGERGFVLYDAAANQARWVLPQAGFFMELPVQGSLMGQLLPEQGARFTRGGAATVAGLRCTEWRVASARGSGTACVTEDGVILSGEGADAKGRGGAIQATGVTYAPQAPGTFEVPLGLHRLSLPRGLPVAPPLAAR